MEDLKIGDKVKWNKFQGIWEIITLSNTPGFDFRIIEINDGFAEFNKLLKPGHDVTKSEISKI